VRIAPAEIGILTLRGRALAMGMLVVIKKGLSKVQIEIKEPLVIEL